MDGVVSVSYCRRGDCVFVVFTHRIASDFTFALVALPY
ncbi:hypothetical protein IMCC1989_2535 [gamma proteobacterium IMCC1989]|nr:hypothetical protein IMCC1989_2535 [gamma proteobacterium IMCC1989]